VRVHLIVRFDGTNNDRGYGDGGGKGTTHFLRVRNNKKRWRRRERRGKSWREKKVSWYEVATGKETRL